ELRRSITFMTTTKAWTRWSVNSMCAWWSRSGRSGTPAGCSLASTGSGRLRARSAIGSCNRQVLLDRTKGASQWTTDHRQAHRPHRQQMMEAIDERDEMELMYRC